jgi:hypothetical protein
MRRAFRGKLCAYCGKVPATSDDHVIAREFFLDTHRANLPKAPSCNLCNNKKSKLELYLTAVLGFGARHEDAMVNLRTMVSRRLDKNARLRKSLVDNFTGEKVPLECGRVEELFLLIAKGLLWHHWQGILGADDCAAATVLQDQGAVGFQYAIARLKPRSRVSANLGEGTLVYEGIQTIDTPTSTIWRFLVYGGLRFGDSRTSNAASLIFAITGPRSLLPRFWETALPTLGADPSSGMSPL